jgi:hypothetical protein
VTAAVMSKSMESIGSPRTNVTTRSKKVEPGLHEPAEQFLAKANDSTTMIASLTEAPRSKKRKLQDVIAAGNLTSSESRKDGESDLESRHSTPESTKKSKKLKSPKESDEKRMRRYRKQAPQSYLQKLHRAQTQRYAFGFL